ncbi:MAG TPA: DUF350 domain-containing protein [Abditibacteriaceae bacterium]|jgi:uncharacterized membrane protein YjfL (UPF0719 family)
MKQRILPFFSLALLACNSSAWAQTAASRPVPNMQSMGYSVVSTLVFGLLGIALAIAGFKLFDAATPFHLEQEICEKQNLAAAILAGFMVLGICIIVAATVLS